ncbi:MAG: glycine cleavage system protein H, partial [Acidobacteriota bacterium]
MVPLLVILTIIGFLAVDLAVQAVAGRRRAKVGKELKLGPSQPLSWNVAVPDGYFLSPGHTWAYLEHNGNVRVGMDDFGRQMMGVPDAMDFPRLGTELRRGEPMATVYIGSRLAHLPAPVDGVVEDVNTPMII